MTVKKGTALFSLYLDCFFICKVQDMKKLNRPEDPFCLRKKALLWEKDAWKPSPCLKGKTQTFGTQRVGSLLYSPALKHAIQASTVVCLPHLNNFQWSLEHCLSPLFQYASEWAIYKRNNNDLGS